MLRCLPCGERLAARLPMLRFLGDGEPPDELVSEPLLLVPEELVVSDPLPLLLLLPDVSLPASQVHMASSASRCALWRAHEGLMYTALAGPCTLLYTELSQ